jgi:hypothetical protein
MTPRIKQRHLVDILENNKFLLISYENFKQRLSTNTLRVSRDLFMENEDYELLHVLENNIEVTMNSLLFINMYNGKRLVISRQDYYYENAYKKVFEVAEIKIEKEILNSYIRISNGF